MVTDWFETWPMPTRCAAASGASCRRRRLATWAGTARTTASAAILLPSYLRYEQDLLARQERVSRAAVVAAYLDRHNAPAAEILDTGEALVRRGMLAGGLLYEAEGRLVGGFGNPPDLAADPVLRAAADRGAASPLRRSVDGPWYDVVWSAGTLGLPYTLVGRIDATPITQRTKYRGSCVVRSSDGPWRSSSGSAASSPKKLRKNAISKVCSVSDASRITTTISAKNTVLPSISSAARP